MILSCCAFTVGDGVDPEGVSDGFALGKAVGGDVMTGLCVGFMLGLSDGSADGGRLGYVDCRPVVNYRETVVRRLVCCCAGVPRSRLAQWSK